MYNAQQYKNNPLSFMGFMIQLILGLNPITLPIWVAGLIFLFGKDSHKYRFLGITVIVFFCCLYSAAFKSLLCDSHHSFVDGRWCGIYGAVDTTH